MAFGLLRKLLGHRDAGKATPPGPGDADAILHEAVRHQLAGRLAEAETGYLRVLQLAPEHPVALHYLGLVALSAENYDLALDLISQSLAARPGDLGATENLGRTLRTMGRVDEAIDLYRMALAAAPDAHRIHSALCSTICFSARRDPQSVFAEHRAWADRFAQPPHGKTPAHANLPDPGRRLRIGYVAFNFNNLINCRYLEDVFRHHDRGGYELFLYENGKEQSGPWARRLRDQSEHWRAIAGLEPAAAAAQIRADGIDVLIDLSGHLADNPLQAFACKPAPVQVTWLSYPASTGLSAMDYRITDAFCDPPGMTEHLYSETLYRMPDTYWCYRPEFSGPVTPLPALSNGFVTFGSFNSFAKVSDPALALWARVLRELPRSRLLVVTVPAGSATRELRERFAGLGGDAERLDIMPGLRPDKFDEVFARADIALDAFPYNGATTTLDSLWNGVPVVTLAGDSCVSRAGVSMLSNVGLQDTIAAGNDEYIAIARRLSGDIDGLRTLRGGLRARLQASPIMNAARFTTDLEAGYRHMWREWCRGAAPKP